MRMKIYHTYIGNTALSTSLWNALPPKRRQQLARRTPTARAEGAVLTALLAKALAEWAVNDQLFCTVEARALTTPYPAWETDADGKPFAEGIDTAAGRVFPGFSHSHGHLLVVLADRPCGADIQVWDAPAFAPDRFRRTAARLLHPAETPPASGRDVARRFAAKEAALKCRGTGLRRALSAVRVDERAGTADELSLFFCEEVPSCIIAAAVSR